MASKSEHWGIVGGGILGMTLALRLAQQGKQVTLIESGDRLGGLADAWRLGDIIWDRHYHVILLSDTYLRSLLTELGLEQNMQWVETKTGFYNDGKLYSISNAIEFLRFFPLNLIDKLRFAFTIIYGSKITDWKKLEKISVSDWLIRWSGKHVFEKIWLPLLRSKLGENYRKASASFIWAIIARLYAARRTGLKKEMFGYLAGGYDRILERFTEVLLDLNVSIKLGHRVEKIESLETSNSHIVNVEFADGSYAEFDRVIVTVPAPIAAKICHGLANDEIRRLQDIEYQGIICASVLLKNSLSQFYVTNITDTWVPFTGVIEMSAMVSRSQFGGNALVYLPKYVVPDDPAFELSDHELEEKFIQTLVHMYPKFQRSDVLCFQVSRVRHVLAIATLNYSEKLPAIVTSIPNVFVLNTAHILNGTLNVNETIQLAERSMRVMV
ncbi:MULTISPECIES: NAD(P)/FAD-dependent oxidoreductase [Pseudanabaena]|uniref:Amine oxidase n=2 Tax=Pseudanabaena TaxID=1152 RepID=L8MZ42_9CYAN|nr:MULTISPECIES: NAD(P)/FAD-dependent oxidoreductase [Pseudanabaena]ELS32064.1 amine oxidase [Pseudanabaena biceps PCC 7429]MDG3495681.1 NAD(P)/FAD-dependent oxidoreductase [Pseudanabaena catenata USMAC16]